MRDTWLKEHVPPIKYVGEGSSRAAYACSGGKCLKVAMTDAGIDQNKQEIRNVPVGQAEYSCFPQNYAYDEKYYGSILTECCSKIEWEDFNDLYSVENGPISVTHALRDLLDAKGDFRRAADELAKWIESQVKKFPHVKYSMDSYYATLRIMEELAKPDPAPQYKSLADLVRFYADHGGSDSQLRLSDLETEANWGLALRDGKYAPVVIDAGFSDEVQAKHYRKR